MSDPETYPKLMMQDSEQVLADALALGIPEPFGTELARALNNNPEFRAWAEAHVTVTDLDGECPACHGRGCGDCLNEDAGDDR
jgi:hypothetical protein